MFGQNNDNDQNYDPRINLMLIRNGKPSIIKNIKIISGLPLNEFQKQIQKAFEFKSYKQIRIFKNEGVELDSDDIPYIHDNEMLYISKGENFDASSNFAIYDLKQVIGQGGYGQVYYAINKLTDKPVAIKMMKSRSMKNTEQIQKVYKEIEALKQLDHKNILQVENGFFLKEQQSFAIVLEYLEGGDLKQFIQEQPQQKLTEQKAQHIFRQLVVGMQYCHSQNIIHRDLKLENLMFSDKEKTHLKVVDFGIVGIDTKHFDEKTNAGSLRYLAPEVIISQARAHPSIDVWGLGVILFYLVTGHPPFNGSTQSEIQEKIINARFSFKKLNNFKENEISNLCKDLIKQILVVDVSKRLHINQIRHHPWLKQEIDEIWEKQKEEERIQQIENEKQDQILKLQEQNQIKEKRQNKYLRNSQNNINLGVRLSQNNDINNKNIILHKFNQKSKVTQNSYLRTVNSQRYSINQNLQNNQNKINNFNIQNENKQSTRNYFLDTQKNQKNKQFKHINKIKMNKSHQQQSFTQGDNEEPTEYKNQCQPKLSLNIEQDNKKQNILNTQNKNTLNIPNFQQLYNSSQEKKGSQSTYVQASDTLNTHDNSITPNNKYQKIKIKCKSQNEQNQKMLPSPYQKDNFNRNSFKFQINNNNNSSNIYPNLQNNAQNQLQQNQSINNQSKSLQTPQRKLLYKNQQQQQKFNFSDIKKNFTAKEKMSQEYFQYLWDCKLKEEIQKQQKKLIQKQKQLEEESKKLQLKKLQSIQKSPTNNNLRPSQTNFYSKIHTNSNSNTGTNRNSHRNFATTFTEMDQMISKSKDRYDYINENNQNNNLKSTQNSPKVLKQIKLQKIQ